MRPIFRWAGGKRNNAEQIAAIVNANGNAYNKRLISPFLGAGSFELEALRIGLARSAWLADACEPVISVFTMLRDAKVWKRARVMLEAFQQMSEADQRAHFLETRGATADWFLFLIRQACSVQGIWRVSKKEGKYNVPFSHAAHFALDELERSATLLQSMPVTLACCDFAQTVAQAEDGDLVFADPPWSGTHSAYTREGFGDLDHLRLMSALQAAKARGADCWVMGSDCAETRETYAPVGRHQTVYELQVRNNVSPKASGRGMRTDLLIHL